MLSKMKTINAYITEKFNLSNKTDAVFYHPQTRDELSDIIHNHYIDDDGMLDLRDVDVKNITDMSDLFSFSSQRNIKYIDISNWDTSNVEDMYAMFIGCDTLIEIKLADLCVNNVENMSNMFAGCKSLETINLSKWNVGACQNFENMFTNCKKLKNLNINSWKVHTHKTKDMFHNVPEQCIPAWYKK